MTPNKISQTVLDRLAAPGEVLAVVVTTAGSGLGTFVLQGRSNRTFAFQFSKTRGAHVLRFPASFWTARKGEVARELFDHSAQPMVPTVEPWDASRSLSEVVMPPAAAAEEEAAPIPPNSDPAPTGPGLAVLVDPTPEQIEEARRQGREDFGLDSALGNPFVADLMPALHQAWQAGFDEATAEHDKEIAAGDEPPATTGDHPAVVGDLPPVFRLDGKDIFLGGERVGGLFDPGDHLRMAKGKTELRFEVEAFLATLP